MTGANTDPVSVPPYQTVSAAILRIASDIFYKWARSEVSCLEDGDYRDWSALRRILRRIDERQSLELAQSEIQALHTVLAKLTPNRDTEFVLSIQFAERG